ncbi:hypothetical protein NSQ45_05145 [Caldifermentibacillus hisashii]|uniref:hypothetical protein n=1 Tax=Caldifermentibacillus hisashii TaxID=996558 RepID=UPI001C118CE3|nr:hypothetical protein [Caldifermentibacillus hisashii]MBU5340967.1 hypothetical protein [Caldifermentibacillus hisashii]
MTTRLVLVAVFRRKTLYFGDENQTRYHFRLENTNFWRRASFSSPFWGEKHYFLATRIKLVTILGWKRPIFDDETCSRRRF